LPRALACGARARDGEKSLLIGQLPASTARLACNHAGAFLCAGAVTGFAEFLAGQLDFCGDARGCFFKRKRHVIAQIGAALSASATAATSAAEEILEAEEIAKDVVEVLESRVVKSLAPARAGKTGVTVGVIHLALLRVAEHAVGLRAFAKLYFRFGFVFRIAVGMPFQRGFPVGRLDLIHRSRACYAEHFVKIPLSPFGH
jgi:hypothetical protein